MHACWNQASSGPLCGCLWALFGPSVTCRMLVSDPCGRFLNGAPQLPFFHVFQHLVLTFLGLFWGTLCMLVGLVWALLHMQEASFGPLQALFERCAATSGELCFSPPGADFSGPLLGHLVRACGGRLGSPSQAGSVCRTLAHSL